MKRRGMKKETMSYNLNRILKTVAIVGIVPVVALVASAGLAGGAPGNASSGTALTARSVDDWKLPPEAKTTKNPTKPGPDSVAKGKALYTSKCLGCHGANGEGNAVMAEKLKVKMPDLTRKKEMAEVSDGEMFWMLTVGKKPMPSVEKTIPKDDRWHVVNYVRTLAK